MAHQKYSVKECRKINLGQQMARILHCSRKAADRCLVIERKMYYVFAMIRTWRNAATRKLWDEERSSPFRGLDLDTALELLAALNVAKSLNDLSPLKSVGLHKLKGSRKSQWAMTVNARWRICFEFRDGDAYEVEIVDYHKG